MILTGNEPLIAMGGQDMKPNKNGYHTHRLSPIVESVYIIYSLYSRLGRVFRPLWSDFQATVV